MSDDQRKHTVTFKGASMEDPWLVLGGDSTDELMADIVNALGLGDSEAATLTELMAEGAVKYRGLLNVAKGLGGVAAAPQGGGYSAPQQQAAPQQNYQQQPPTMGSSGHPGDKVKPGGFPPPAGPRPSCAHGERVWISGQNAGKKPYKMWACSGPREQQCEAVWA